MSPFTTHSLNEADEEDLKTLCDEEENDDNDDNHNHDDLDSVILRGSDIDYVRANIHCASSIGNVFQIELITQYY